MACQFRARDARFFSGGSVAQLPDSWTIRTCFIKFKGTDSSYRHRCRFHIRIAIKVSAQVPSCTCLQSENHTMSNDLSSVGQTKLAAPVVAAKPMPARATAPVAAPAVPEAVEAPPPEVKEPKFEPLVSTEEMRENLRAAVKRLNEMMQEGNRDLNFSMDEVTDRVVITVKNANTGEVVRQIPDATLMRMAHNLENLKGVLHNESI